MRRTRLIALTALTAAGLALAACSSGGDPAEGVGGETAPAPGAVEPIPVTVGVVQVAPSAGVQLGIDEGIFAEHGLELTVQPAAGGAALLPAVTTGSVQFAIGNPLTVLVAAAQGLELKIISNFSDVADTEDAPTTGLVVRDDADIQSWADLEGKAVATNLLNNIGDLMIKAAVEKDGGNPDAVSFTEIAFPDQPAQLEQGHLVAGLLPEPFLNQAIATDGISFLGNPYSYVMPAMPTMVAFTSAEYAEQNPEIVDAFRAAIDESTALAMADEQLYRAAIVAFTGIPAEVVAEFNLDNLTAELDPALIEELTALGLRFGQLPAEPDLDSLLLLE